MRKIYTIPGRKRIIVVSLFSGMDLFLLGMIRTGMLPGYAIEKNFNACEMHRHRFKHTDGTPVMEDYVVIAEEDYRYKKAHRNSKGQKDMEDEVGVINGQYVRTKLIQEVNGRDIRAALEKRYGKDIIIILIGGPPCTDYTNLNPNRNTGDDSRNQLVFQYLRILAELDPDVALMEEVTEFGPSGKFKEIYDEFLKEAEKLPYRSGEQQMCSIHYGDGHQVRWRRVFQFVAEGYNTHPVFPATENSAKRVKDFLDIDYFVMGGYDRVMRDPNQFMLTVTSGTPTTFFKGAIERQPTIDELLDCMDVRRGEYPFPEGIPHQQKRKAIGNGVCVNMAEALGKNIIENILRMKPDGDGYFVPIDTEPVEPDGNDPRKPINDLVTGEKVNEETEPAVGSDSLSGVAGPITSPPFNNDGNAVDDHTNEYMPEAETQDYIEISNPAKTEPVNTAATIAGDQQTFKFMVPGFVIWQGPSQINGDEIVAILTLSSHNEKTGDMAQLWMLNAGVSPLEALEKGSDESVCGDCKLRHNKNGACYVRVGESPNIIWKAWRNGAYPELPVSYFSSLSGIAVRFGAYGDPAAIPAHILFEIRKHVKNYTGYTHQWRNAAFAELKSLCMASVDNPDEQREALAMGWRTFKIIKEAIELLPGEILCPNNTHGVQCKKCQLCRGTSRKAKNIAIPVHGNNKNKFKTVAAMPEKAEAEPLPPLRNVIKAISDLSKDDPSKIISSERLFEMEFDCLNFEDEWNELFGLPSVNFHLIIHGKSGHGKSTFAVQFAKYLADNFGKVLYVSGEEGFSKTLQNKFVNNDASAASLDIADVRSYDEFIRVVPRGSYNFIFLDSLDTMKIDTDKLRSIKQHYKNTAIITISQATKGGQMRGSNAIMHDSDIAVEVVDGMATTTKNRFKERGMRFNVFQQMNGAEEVDTQSGEKKIPKLLTKEARIEILTKRMFAAAAAEKYEEAAKLRDQIKRIVGEK